MFPHTNQVASTATTELPMHHNIEGYPFWKTTADDAMLARITTDSSRLPPVFKYRRVRSIDQAVCITGPRSKI
jgi:hypothetical protein